MQCFRNCKPCLKHLTLSISIPSSNICVFETIGYVHLLDVASTFGTRPSRLRHRRHQHEGPGNSGTRRLKPGERKEKKRESHNTHSCILVRLRSYELYLLQLLGPPCKAISLNITLDALPSAPNRLSTPYLRRPTSYLRSPTHGPSLPGTVLSGIIATINVTTMFIDRRAFITKSNCLFPDRIGPSDAAE
ncbi:hypothetical protein LXL04_031774 [Taraxacum kok-saghyz]